MRTGALACAFALAVMTAIAVTRGSASGGSPARAATAYRVHVSYRLSRCGNLTSRILLTFDDWSPPRKILAYGELLRKRRIGAEFFLDGFYAADHPEIVRRLRRWGFWVGNHSYTGQLLTPLSDDEVRRHIELGVKGTYFRPPHGAHDARVDRIAESLGYRVCTWTVNPQDWRYRKRPASLLIRLLRAQLHSSSTVVLHLQGHSLEALPRVIRDARKRGLRFCRLPAHATTWRVPYPLPC